jgi:hypothetical protein
LIEVAMIDATVGRLGARCAIAMLAVASIVAPQSAAAAADPTELVHAQLCSDTKSTVYSPPSLLRILGILAEAHHDQERQSREFRTATGGAPEEKSHQTTLTISGYEPPPWFIKKLQHDYGVRVVHKQLGRYRSIVLRDSIAFQGAWRTTFDKGKTRDLPFFSGHGAVQRPFMTGIIKANYRSDSAGEYIRLPFTNGYHLVLALPRLGTTLCAVVQHGSGPANRWKADKYLIQLPIAAVSTTWDISPAVRRYAPYLLTLKDSPGMPSITALYQRASVQITEDRTVATAETVAKAMPLGFPMARKRIIFDRPFVFAIVDPKDVVLFTGKVQ